MKRFLAFVLVFALLLTPALAAGEHSIVCAGETGGSITAEVSSAKSGDVVTGSVTPLPGWDIATVRVEWGGKTLYADLEGDTFSFTMPDGDVTLVPAFYTLDVWDGAVDVSWYDPALSEFEIGTPAQLAGLAALVNGMVDIHTPEWRIKGDRSYISCTAYPNVLLVGAGGGNVSDTVYCSELDFAYKTVRLTADLDMGGVPAPDGTWSGPNWTPIGGKFSMDPEEIKGDSFVLDTRFNGVLDGCGHTVRNISCYRYAAKGFPYSMAIGLVGYLGGSGDVSGISADFEGGWQPAVRNVTVGHGYIYGRRMVAGVVGRIGKTNNGVVVENCANYADVLNTDAKGVGGVVGAGWGKGVIRNCYNAGDISTIFSCPAGGICASNDGLDIYNCYNVGTINSNGAIRGRAIGGHDSGSYAVLNCYYLEGCDDDPGANGWYAGTAAAKLTLDVHAMTAEQMKDPAFLQKLNGNGAAYVADTAGINDGYPILWYQAGTSGALCSVSVAETEGGSIAAEPSGSVPSGTLLQLSAEPIPGWTLKTYTVNGEAIPGDFWTATEDCVISAVFAEIRTSTLHIIEGPEQELSVRRTGYRYAGESLVWVEDEPVGEGALLLEENILAVSARPYDDIGPEDMDLEYTDGFNLTAENAEKVKSGIFTVTGAGDVTVSAKRLTKKKSWLSLADTSWYDHSGSYVITDAASLAGLALLVNSGREDFAGQAVTLGADISLKNTDGTVGLRTWTGIGTSAERAFRGTFDGQGHVIRDMDAWSDGSYAALFGYTKDAEIRNLTVAGTSSCAAATACAAGLVACAESSLIENCDSRVDVSVAGSLAGGLCAHISGGTVIRGCRNYGSVTALCSIGGLAAVSYSAEDLIEDCYNFGALTATGSGSSGTGGLVGKLSGAILNSGSAGEIVSADRYTGGLAGYTVGRHSSRIEGSAVNAVLRVSSEAVNAAAGSLVGYAQYLRMSDCVSSGTVEAAEGFPESGLNGLVGKAGGEAEITDCSEGSVEADFGFTELPLPEIETKDSYTVSFIADGVTVAVENYKPGDAAVTEPALPEKSGYTGFWSRYELGESDITVTAVYRPLRAFGGDTLTAGRYVIAYGTAGTLTLAAGSGVTLSGEAKGLTVKAEKGAVLTLENVTLAGDSSLLLLEEGCTLRLVGENALAVDGDKRDNEAPTVSFAGTLAIEGSGSLRVTANVSNAAVWSEGGELTLRSGLLLVREPELLGFDGGAVNAAKVTVEGGGLLIFTDSDNVPGVWADSVSLTGGSLIVRSTHTEKVVVGLLTLAGGSARLEGHSPNATGLDRSTKNETAADAVGSGFVSEPAPLGTVQLSNQRVTFLGRELSMEVYNIDGYNYFKLRDIAALMDGTKSSFGVSFEADERAVFASAAARYAFVGGELAPGEDKSPTAVASRWLLFVDGVLLPCRVANIGGNNYFKLQDLGDALGFFVDYDKETRTVIIAP